MASFPFPETLDVLVGQMVFVGFEGFYPPDYLLEKLRAGHVGGVILFSRNVQSPQQIAALTQALHDAATYGVIISIDQEGGTVARLREGFTEFPSALALACAHDGDYWAEKVGETIAAELKTLGIGWDYAPVVDLLYTFANPAMLTRSYGSDPHKVGALAAAAVRGLQKGGVAACAKHFPGLGSTAIDTHVDLPVLDTPLEHLLARDLLPYRAVIEAGITSIMTTHTIYSALDPDLPATLSPVVVHKILREMLGFDGIVTTDCMEMGAITRNFSPQESALKAALAGIDTVLFSHTPALQDAAYAALFEAAQNGQLPMDIVMDANRRIYHFKTTYAQPPSDLAVIRSPDHLDVAWQAAAAGISVSGDALPVQGSVGLVEFVAQIASGIEDRDQLTGLGRALKTRMPDVEILAQPLNDALDAAEALAGRVDTLVLATRNAYLIDAQLNAAQRLIDIAPRTVLVALRSPYDAAVFDKAVTCICTCGDGAPALEAAAAVLAGEIRAEGELPFELESVK